MKEQGYAAVVAVSSSADIDAFFMIGYLRVVEEAEDRARGSFAKVVPGSEPVLRNRESGGEVGEELLAESMAGGLEVDQSLLLGL